MKEPSRRISYISLTFTLFLLVWLSYSQVMHHGFILFDDPGYVTDNIHVRQGFRFSSLSWVFTNTEIGHWHPLTWLSHMLDVSLFGLNPAGHHFMNVLIHALNAILLFLVLLKMTGAIWQSAFTAALFAVHPVNVESVAWIAERKNVLSSFFWIATMGAYGYYAQRPILARYLAVFFLFMVGLMTKPMLVTLPFVLLLLDFWPLDRYEKGFDGISFGKLLLEKIPLFILSIVSINITIHAARSVATIAGLDLIPLGTRIANSLIFYMRYLGKAILPLDLAIIYPYPADWSMACLVIAAFILGIISILVLVKGRAHPYLILGWCWFLGTLAPVIGIIQAGSQSIADRYAYIPFIGLFIMAAWGVPDLLRSRRFGKFSLSLLAALLLLFFLSLAVRQVSYWQSGSSLFSHAAQVVPNNFLAHYLYGKAMLENREYAAAARQFELALRFKPDFGVAYNNLGLALASQNKHVAALAAYHGAVKYLPRDAGIYVNMAESYLKAGRTEQAVQAYEKARSLQPERADIHNNLGLVLTKIGKDVEASKSFQQAVRLQPENAGTRNNLAMILLKQGDIDGAITQFNQALRIEPDFANAHYFIGEAMARKGLLAPARIHRETAIKINPLYGQGKIDALIGMEGKQ